MAKVILKKGVTLEVTEQDAERLQYAIENKQFQYNDFVTIQGQSMRFSTIERVVHNEVADDRTKKLNDDIAQWHKERRIFAAKSPEYKAQKFIEGPALLFFNTYGDSSKEQLQEKAIEFYRENPKRAWPNGTIFRGLVGRPLHSTQWDVAGLNILENTLREDAVAVEEDEEFENNHGIALTPVAPQETVSTDFPF